MVEKVSAGGAHYQEVIDQLGRGSGKGTCERVFLLDGDENKGELHLAHLSGVLEKLATVQHADSQSVLIVDTHDQEREAWVLSVPKSGKGFLPNVRKSENAKSDEIKGGSVPRQEVDKFEGLRYLFQASRKSTPGIVFTFVGIYKPEYLNDGTINYRAAGLLSTRPDQVSVTYDQIDKERFYRQAIRELNEGIRLDAGVLDSDPRIRKHWEQQGKARLKKRR